MASRRSPAAIPAVLGFSNIIGNFGVVLMIGGNIPGRTRVMSTVIFDFSDAGNFEAVATMGILLMVTTLAFVALAYRFAGRELITAQNIQ